jgi:hypothetical protein
VAKVPGGWDAMRPVVFDVTSIVPPAYADNQLAVASAPSNVVLP